MQNIYPSNWRYIVWVGGVDDYYKNYNDAKRAFDEWKDVNDNQAFYDRIHDMRDDGSVVGGSMGGFGFVLG